MTKYKAWGWLSLFFLVLVTVCLGLFIITQDWYQSLIITVFGFPVHLTFLVFGCGCIIKGFFQIFERPILQAALQGKPPKDGHRVALFGTIEPLMEPIHTPFGQKPCVGYKYFIKHIKILGGSDTHSNSQHLIIAAGWALVPAKIVSETGVIRMGGFPLMEDFSEEEKEYDDQSRQDLDESVSNISFEMAGYSKWFVRNIEGFTPESILLGESLSKPNEDPNTDIRKDIKFFKKLYSDYGSRQPDYTVETLIPIGAKVCVWGTYVAKEKVLIPGRWRSIRIINGERSKVLESMRMNYWAWFVVGMFLISIEVAGLLFLTS